MCRADRSGIYDGGGNSRGTRSMLDLNYVRENFEAVRAALAKRRMPADALNDFARADEDRRHVIAESDRLNAERNSASREIGALMKEGKREDADARRQAVGQLK